MLVIFIAAGSNNGTRGHTYKIYTHFLQQLCEKIFLQLSCCHFVGHIKIELLTFTS